MQNTNNNILWYNDLSILFKNLDHFYPNNNLTSIEQINSIARLSIYFFIIVTIFSFNNKLYLISLLLLIISYYYSFNNNNIEEYSITNDNILIKKNKIDNNLPELISKENLDISCANEQYNKCTKPTRSNPFMNYTLGEQYNIDNKERLPACSYEDIKTDMRTKFRSNIHTDLTDIWGQYISDRNFYIMPNTDIINNQTGFAKWCYSSIDSGECKTYGSNCLKYRDPKYHIGRFSF